MQNRTTILTILLVCLSSGLFNTDAINSAYADQKNAQEEHNNGPAKIHGKVTDIIEASVYTYAEVDAGKKKVWAAGPTTPLKIGDMIAFSTEMPMENFHSKSMKRDFPIIYFVSAFITHKEGSTTKSAGKASPHSQIKQQQAAKPVKGINKVEGGNTIAEIYAQKQKLNGKTIRVRGQVSKFTAEVMGKNWIHIRDSSSNDDLTINTQGTVAIGDVVTIEGKLKLDKDYSYGYVYPVILENAKVTKE